MTQHIRWDSTERGIVPTQKPFYLKNTQHSQQTDVHAPGGIRTRHPASQPPQTYTLDRSATGVGVYPLITHKQLELFKGEYS